jgi:hypothetical protein
MPDILFVIISAVATSASISDDGIKLKLKLQDNEEVGIR